MKTRIFPNLILTLLCLQAEAEVDLISGGYVQRIDQPLTEELDATVRLNFRSRSTWITNLGFGWCGPWNAMIVPIGDQSFRFDDCESRLTFYPQASPAGGDPRMRSSQGDELRKDPKGYWVFKISGERLKFDPQGKILERWQNAMVETFEYDVLNRVRRWQSPMGLILFRYTGVSLQLSALQLNGVVTSFRHAGEDLVAIRSRYRSFAFDYDDVHNLTVVREPGQLPTRIDYDSENDRVKQIQDSRKCMTRYEFRFPAKGEQNVITQTLCPGLPPNTNETKLTLKRTGDRARLQSLVREIQGERMHFLYGPDNRLMELRTTNLGSLTFQYDDTGSLLRIAGAGDEVTQQRTLQLALESL